MQGINMPQPIVTLTEELLRLPGIGPKTAARLTFYLLQTGREQVRTLESALRDLRENTAFCSVCFGVTESTQDPCSICRNEKRDRSIICVVENPLDVLAFERIHEYRGMYHVLHGFISPIEGIGPEKLKIRELVDRVTLGGIQEVILATNPSMEGESTGMYVRHALESLPVRVTRLARGLAMGSELEYVDEATLSRALEGRTEI